MKTERTAREARHATLIDRVLARRNELFREINAAPTWKADSPWMRDRVRAVRQLDRQLDNLAERGVEAITA